jgi:hypothetical protein
VSTRDIRSLTGQLLGVSVEIIAGESARAGISDWFGDLLAEPADGPPAVTLHADGGIGGIGGIHVLLAELSLAVVAASPLLCIHAGVVSTPRGLVVIPGQSGLGKTTLVAALVRAGFGYASDEALAIDRDTLTATALPRPLALARDVWPIFATGAGVGDAPPAGSEGLIRPAALGHVDSRPARVHDIVLAQRLPETDGARVPATLELTARGAGAQALLSRAFNHFADPPHSFRAVVAVVRQARVWRATYSHAPDLAATMSEQFGAQI